MMAATAAGAVEQEDAPMHSGPPEVAEHEDEEQDPEEEGEAITGIGEARSPQKMAEPHLPSKAEVDDHYRHHWPYRSWCPICNAAAGREEPHCRNAGDKEGEAVIPTFTFDYDHFGEGVKRVERATRLDNPERAETEVTGIVMKDCKSGMIWAHTAMCKGPKDKWLVKRICEDIEYAGNREIRLKCDGEPAAKSFQSAIVAERGSPRVTLPINPPAYDPLANGAAEQAVQAVNVQLRKYIIGLESRTGERYPAKHPIMEWALEHSAFTLSRVVVGEDGKTPYERLCGRQFRGKFLEFGEQVMAKLAKPKPQSRMKRKISARMVKATWVGMTARTGEHRVVTGPGRAIRVRTIKRRPVEVRWSGDAIMAIEATPRRPDPRRPQEEEMEAKVVDVENDDLRGLMHEDARGANQEQEHQEAAPAQPEAPRQAEMPRTQPKVPRELCITKRLLAKFGSTPGCPGCIQAQIGIGQRAHTTECRLRIYKAMQEDPTELERLERAVIKFRGPEVHEGNLSAAKEKTNQLQGNP